MHQSHAFPVSLLHAWRGQVATISLRDGLRYRVLHQQATLFPRFAAYYAQLQALTKAARRQLQRHWARSLAGVALLFVLGHGSAQAAQFTAGTAAELNTAIGTANSTIEADTVTLTQDIVLTTAAATATDGDTGTVVVKSAITIEGQGHTIRRAQDAPEFRLLRVDKTGDLTVRQTSLRGGQVTGNGKKGGGLRNEGSVTLEECTVSGNTATEGGGVWSATRGSSQMTLSNSTVSGNSAYVGGGVESRTYDTSQMTLINSTVSGNSAAGDGGGVYSRTYDTSQLTLTNSTVSGNTALVGGGVYSRTEDTSQLTLSASTVSGNTALVGGGVYSLTLYTSQLTLSASTVSDNSASVGGGMNSTTFESSQMTLSNSTISGNSASYGGGVWSITRGSSQVTLTNSTITGNSATYGGGVMSRPDGSSQITLTNSTVTGNSALVGGGVYSRTRDSSQVTLQRMLLAGNNAESGAEVFFYSSSSVLNTTFNLFGHSGLTTADALKGFFIAPTDLLATSDSGFSYALPAILNPTLAHNGGLTLTHNLVPDSLAIDAAGTCELTTDQRGIPRPQRRACDIGAVEFSEAEESCGNCIDDDGDGLVDFADPNCTHGTSAIPHERATFTLTPAPRRDQLTLTATLAGGSALNPPIDGIGVQLLDEQSRDSLLCVHLPPAIAAPGAWSTKVSDTAQVTWKFKDAPNGSRGDPSKDTGTITYDPSKGMSTVKLTIKETEIGGDATARDLRTGIGSGMSRWQKIQPWTPKAGGKKLGTP